MVAYLARRSPPDARFAGVLPSRTQSEIPLAERLLALGGQTVLGASPSRPQGGREDLAMRALKRARRQVERALDLIATGHYDDAHCELVCALCAINGVLEVEENYAARTRRARCDDHRNHHLDPSCFGASVVPTDGV